MATREARKGPPEFTPKLEWCYEHDWPKWREPPLEAIWREPKSLAKTTTCYYELLQNCVKNIFQLSPIERLHLLIAYLKRRKTKRDQLLVKRFQAVIEALENIDDDWQADGTAADIVYYVDLYVEMMLPRYLNAILQQLNVEGLFMDTPFKEASGFKEPMRLAAGLPKEISKEVDDLIMQVHESLIAEPRKQRNEIMRGGRNSKLIEKRGELLHWYQSLHPIWKDAKAIYKKNPSGVGRIAILHKYESIFSGENSKAFYRNRDGLPPELVDKMISGDAYESSPEYLAYRHAAFMCGFGVSEYSVKQIKRVVAAYKKQVKELGFSDAIRPRSRDIEK